MKCLNGAISSRSSWCRIRVTRPCWLSGRWYGGLLRLLRLAIAPVGDKSTGPQTPEGPRSHFRPEVGSPSGQWECVDAENRADLTHEGSRKTWRGGRGATGRDGRAHQRALKKD